MSNDIVIQILYASFIVVVIVYGIMEIIKSLVNQIHNSILSYYWDINDHWLIEGLIKSLKVLLAVSLTFLFSYLTAQYYIKTNDILPVILIASFATAWYKSIVKILLQLPDKIVTRIFK